MSLCACTHERFAHRPRMSSTGAPRTVPDGCMVDKCKCEKFVEAEQKSDKMDAELSAALLEFDRIGREHKKLGERLDAIKGVLKSKLMSQA